MSLTGPRTVSACSKQICGKDVSFNASSCTAIDNVRVSSDEAEETLKISHSTSSSVFVGRKPLLAYAHEEHCTHLREDSQRGTCGEKGID